MDVAKRVSETMRTFKFVASSSSPPRLKLLIGKRDINRQLKLSSKTLHQKQNHISTYSAFNTSLPE